MEIEFILGSLRRKMGCKKEKKNTEINMGKRIMNRKIVVANNKLLTDPGIFYYGRLINLFLVGHHKDLSIGSLFFFFIWLRPPGHPLDKRLVTHG